MYYIWSLLASSLLFAVIQYNEYDRISDKKEYNLFTISNIATFVILYIILTIMIYMFTDGSGVSNIFTKNTIKGGTDNIKSASADPNILRKISDNVYTGFSPKMKSDV